VAEMALEIHIDRERCMGSGNCAFHAPATFDLDDEMKAIVIDACPTLALSIKD
jgi:ferredoxin